MNTLSEVMLPKYLPSLYIKKYKTYYNLYELYFLYNKNVRILCNYSFADKIDIFHYKKKDFKFQHKSIYTTHPIPFWKTLSLEMYSLMLEN